MKSPLLKFFNILPVICLVITYSIFFYIGVSKCETPEQTPGIVIDGLDNPIVIIKDTRRNLQWDAIQYKESLVIIPGTEKPIKTSP